MAKKKVNGLSVAIIALNIVIVGIVILLVVLVYLHMKEDTDNGRGEITTTTPPPVSESDTLSQSGAPEPPESTTDETTPDSEENPEETTTAPITPVASYNRGFFDNDLFIGDSISTGLYLYGFLDKANVFAEVGLNPESALYHQIEGVTSIEKTAAMQPRNIYIMLGTNGLAFLDGNYMANKLVELIAELEVACPTANIYVITIPPVTAAHEAEGQETMDMVNAYNSEIRDLCRIGGYGCIDLCTLLQDGNGYLAAQYAEADGLHFLGDAYIAMLSYIEQNAGSN